MMLLMKDAVYCLKARKGLCSISTREHTRLLHHLTRLPHGVTIGSGVGPTKIQHVVGVSKAYTTRVGDGPFPTELKDEIGDQIREVGREYGTTTGRPRRVGWFDSVVVRHARRVSGITDLSLNSIDVLTGIETLKICVAYRYKGEIIEEFPASLKALAECEPDTKKCRDGLRTSQARKA